MALVLKDRVREQSTSSGTGSITLGGAYVGYQSFNTAIANGSTVYYTIKNTTAPNDGEWEVGVGTFTAPSTLSRDTVLSSSAGGTTKVNFSSASVLEVFVTQPAEEAVYINQATGKVEAFGDGTNSISFTDINTSSLTANTVTLTSGTITTNASNATDITNKTYVDGLFSTGISYHDPVRVESPTALSPVTYNNGSSGVGATLTNAGTQTALVIDGVTLSLNDRVLIYTQTDQTQNGIYTVTNVGSGSTNWVLTRAADANSYGLANPNKLGQGDAVFVQQGVTGAGETYVCNTPGTIVFGTTNITFAQISTAQIYSAGTGLNLSNLTFSIANTAVTAATYGNAGAVAQFTVNAQGQITNAANVSINASSITLGTLDNARTTASASNGANTIVLRDSTGSFTANTITATTSNATTFNGTTGSFTNVSGNGSAISAINASNISTGTIANARTTGNTANSANTLVLRDANGNFGSNVISASLFSGDGSGINAINASNISSGTIANARTTAASANGASTIVQRDSGGNFSANTVTAAVIGDISGGSNINASNISSGTIANARTTASSSNGASTIVLRGASGEFAAGAITATSFSGNGSAITAINASAITTGTLDNARTTASSANGANTIVSRDANGSFSANTVTATSGSFTSVSGNGVALTAINASNIASGTIANARTTGTDAATANTLVLRDANASFSANVITATTISGNGASLTNINASNISTGTIANARTTAATANGASTIVLRGTSGEFAAGAITGAFFIGDGSNVSAINGSNVTTGTVANARTTAASANGASTIVARDANGSFAANVGTFVSVSGAHSGNGSGLSDINASNISTGTIANARTTGASANGASTLVLRDANGSFAGNVITGTTGSFTSVSGNGVALTAINASNITSGTIANARTTASDANGASTIVSRDANGSFTANTVTATTFSGGGGSISAINASNISTGTIANARTTAASANGASTIVARDANGSFTANVGTFTTVSGAGGGLTGINASNVTSGTLDNARTTAASANGASTIVARDASGNFSAGTITASLSGTATTATNWGSYGAVPAPGTNFGTANTIGRSDASGYTYFNYINSNTVNSENPTVSQIIVTNGTDNFYRKSSIASLSGQLTGINASNVTTGTLSNTRTTASSANGASTIVARDASGNFTSNQITANIQIADQGFFVNKLTIASSYTIPSGYSAMSTGPITLSAGVSVTVPGGSKWTVL